MATIHKLDPRFALSLTGFDRRGAVASINNATASGFTVSGAWSDQADFANLLLFNADDLFGHLYTSRYLPDFSLAGVTLDVDLAITGCQYPASTKYQSVPWGKLSYITSATETPGTVALPAPTSTSGGVAASVSLTLAGTPTNYDRIQIVFLGNEVFDYTLATGQLLSDVAYAFAAYINANYTSATVPLTCTSSGPTITFTCTQVGRDGNGIQLFTMYKTAGNTQIYPTASGQTFSGQIAKLTGGVDPTSMHYHLDFSSLGLASCRQIWLTLAPGLTYNSSFAAPGIVEFGFFNYFGTGYSHQITIGANTYTHVQLSGDGSGDIALALAALINAAGDPNASAVIDPAARNQVILISAGNGGASVNCSASDGNGPGTLTEAAQTQSLVAYAPTEWSMVFSNWTVVDSGGVTPLKIAGPGSVTVGSRDAWCFYTGLGWSRQAGNFFHGFAEVDSTPGDQVTVTYSCQHTHSLYLGTQLSSGAGTFSITVDSGSPITLVTAADALSPISTRRLVKASVAAGTHTVVMSISSGTCVFDYLQAAVLSDPVSPAVTYPHVSAACDYDTDQTYKIPPVRALWIMSQMGFQGDIDFYAGVFFALKRVRVGGYFHKCTVTLAGTPGTGSGFGDGDVVWMTVGWTTQAGTLISGATTKGGNPSGGSSIGGTVLGAAAYPADTPATLAQRLVDAINGTFVGICAAPGPAAGQFTVTVLSPINGFGLDVSLSSGASLTLGVSGDIGSTYPGLVGGNEGTWGVDASQTSPLNRGFRDYLADFAALVHAAGQTMTVAFSQELLAPPDANTSAGAWIQRFASGATVLTATGFGSWGAGVVESVSGSGPQTIQQTGHGYITGNTVHVAQGSSGAVWAITMTDANHYQLTTLVSGTSFTVAAGATTLIDLQTSQCTFNPETVTAYLAYCYKQAAGVLAAAGLTPWLQFGEILWWFFSCTMSLPVSGFASVRGIGSNGQPADIIEVQTSAAHGFITGQNAILAGTGLCDGTHVIIVIDSTHFTIVLVWPGGTPAAAGTVSGGGMAYYDAWAQAAATTALGRALASFATQDDDPTVNSSADANWLAGAIKAHIDAIRAAVLASYSGAKFELLYPQDVNAATCYYTPDVPYPQGGQLNHAVNFPPAYQAMAGSGLNRLKMEGLSWGSTYRNLAQAKVAMTFPEMSPNTWALANTAYLVPWFNGGCPWTLEYLASLQVGIPLIVMWAGDQMVLFSWPLPLPVSGKQAVIE